MTAEEVWQGHDVGWRLLSRVTPKANKKIKDNKEKDNKTCQHFYFLPAMPGFLGRPNVCLQIYYSPGTGCKGAADVTWQLLQRVVEPRSTQQRGPAKAALPSSWSKIGHLLGTRLEMSFT